MDIIGKLGLTGTYECEQVVSLVDQNGIQRSVKKGNVEKGKNKGKEKGRKNGNKSSSLHLQGKSKKRKGVESHPQMQGHGIFHLEKRISETLKLSIQLRWMHGIRIYPWEPDILMQAQGRQLRLEGSPKHPQVNSL